MNTTKLSWTRFCSGCYQATDHHGWQFEARSIEFHTEGESLERSWILFRNDPSPDGDQDGYWNHFATLADAKMAAQEGIDELDAKGLVSWS